jgi:hypothetical protein
MSANTCSADVSSMSEEVENERRRDELAPQAPLVALIVSLPPCDFCADPGVSSSVRRDETG